MATEGIETHDDYQFLRHCEKETAEPVNGAVKGNIPSWLQGELISVGPGIQGIGNDQYKHIFDGLAILHKFTVKDGKASYQSRALRSDAYKKNMEANRIVVSEFGTFAYPDPCKSLFGRLKSDFKALASLLGNPDSSDCEMTDNCCVNVAYHGDQLYAMTETQFVRRVDPSDLQTVGEKTNISKYIAVNSATAHPHVLEDGTIINVGNNVRHAGGPHYCFIKVPPSFNSEEPSFANAELIGEIPSRWKLHACYFHSFGITNSGKLIFVEYPYCLNLLGLVAGQFMHHSYIEWMKWYPKEKTRFYVMSMNDGKLHPIIYETDELFLFHHINAFEENGEVVVDVAGYSDADWIVGKITKDDSKKSASFSKNPCARRYVLPLSIESAKAGENLVKTKSTATATLRDADTNVVDLTPHRLTNGLSELPRINYSRNGKNYSYFYALGEKQRSWSSDFGMENIHKVDVNSGEKISWTSDEAVRASEPVFVANLNKPNPSEDDGVVLAALLSRDKPTLVSLLVLDAKNMSEIGRIDFSAEGTWVISYIFESIQVVVVGHGGVACTWGLGGDDRDGLGFEKYMTRRHRNRGG